ncbi:MAG: carbohydrate ABC transporter permease [Sphaerochaetaceae bacterium]|jgi:ABC-type glycerol-3-phosphate transport system permease component
MALLHRRIHPKARKMLGLLGVALICLVFIFPVLWILSVSLRLEKDVFSTTFAMSNPHFENYLEAWNTFNFSDLFINSILVTGISIVVTLMFSSLAGYGFAKLKYNNSNSIYIVLLTGVMIPQAGILIPFFLLMRLMGLYNTLLSVVISCVAFGIPLSVLLFRGFFSGLAEELLEAARVDGCNELRIFWCVGLPLCKSAIATSTIMLFVTNWNDYLMPLILLRDTKKYTLPLGIARYIGQWESPWNLVAAGVILSAMPITVVYLAFQKQFVKGLTEGAVKG